MKVSDYSIKSHEISSTSVSPENLSYYSDETDTTTASTYVSGIYFFIL